jgi:copper(I)-binding protein
MGGGQMSMQPVSQIDISAGKTVKLEPGGYHIMLMDLKAPLTKGQTFPITLTFSKAGEKTVTATVSDTAP